MHNVLVRQCMTEFKRGQLLFHLTVVVKCYGRMAANIISIVRKQI